MYQVPSVIRKTGMRHAIILKKGRKLFEVIEMAKTQLIIRTHSEAELVKEGYKPTDLSPYETAEKFLKHTAGVSYNADLALKKLVALKFLD